MRRRFSLDIIPAGRKRGLRNDPKYRDRCNSIRSAPGFEEIPSQYWDEQANTQWHQNKDAYYRYTSDQDGLGSCFPAGTLVRMKDGSEKAIDQIGLLEEVLTAEGNTGRVMQTMVRDHNGTICRLLINGSHHVRMTPEHPVLTERGYVKAAELVKNDMVAFPRYMPEAISFIQTLDYVWSRVHSGSHRTTRATAKAVRIMEIPGKPAVAIHRHQLPDIIHLTYGFGRIIGLFLAEGCTSHGKATWTFAAHEKDTLASELIELFASELNVTAGLQVRGNSTVKVNVYGTQWADLFDALCSRLSHGKRLHPDLTNGPKEFLRGVLTGWTDGDGIGPGKEGGGTTSHFLAVAMFDIANALGFKPGIQFKIPRISHGVKSRKPVWIVTWGHGILKQKTDYRKHQSDNCLWRRVESVEHDDFNGPVFNLEVEGDHSYVAECIGVHNCAAESACNTKAACDARQGLPMVIYNPLFLYYTTSGGGDRGSVIGENLELARDKGCCPEEIWPRSKGFRSKPSTEAYNIASFFRLREFFALESRNQIPSALLQGWFVHAGYDGHAVSFSRYLPGKKLWFKNSWGNWGENGFGPLPLSSIFEGYGMYAYKDVIAYYDPLTGRWGLFNDDGTFTECPWKPQHDQVKLAVAVEDYVGFETARKIDNQRAMSVNQIDELYRWCLQKHGLVT